MIALQIVMPPLQVPFLFLLRIMGLDRTSADGDHYDNH
jgi:hypothetical protein